MHHPFAELIGLQLVEQTAGRSVCTLALVDAHLNPHGVAHGAVLYALADTAMGAALYPTLASDESCATVEIKITYFKPARSGTLRCVAELVHRGRRLANLDAGVWHGDRLVAKANGNFAIFARDG